MDGLEPGAVLALAPERDDAAIDGQARYLHRSVLGPGHEQVPHAGFARGHGPDFAPVQPGAQGFRRDARAGLPEMHARASRVEKTVAAAASGAETPLAMGPAARLTQQLKLLRLVPQEKRIGAESVQQQVAVLEIATFEKPALEPVCLHDAESKISTLETVSPLRKLRQTRGSAGCSSPAKTARVANRDPTTTTPDSTSTSNALITNFPAGLLSLRSETTAISTSSSNTSGASSTFSTSTNCRPLLVAVSMLLTTPHSNFILCSALLPFPRISKSPILFAISTTPVSNPRTNENFSNRGSVRTSSHKPFRNRNTFPQLITDCDGTVCTATEPQPQSIADCATPDVATGVRLKHVDRLQRRVALLKPPRATGQVFRAAQNTEPALFLGINSQPPDPGTMAPAGSHLLARAQIPHSDRSIVRAADQPTSVIASPQTENRAHVSVQSVLNLTVVVAPHKNAVHNGSCAHQHLVGQNSETPRVQNAFLAATARFQQPFPGHVDGNHNVMRMQTVYHGAVQRKLCIFDPVANHKLISIAFQQLPPRQ
ncbi:hypothetical protein OGATHE_000586 [Ogataea polymorpha]|uniref:Uncharacterized protein n=1 Tax=Ogataea polymorpha TaxID=460523 RepID=A0A9P8TGW9_9ASCO|nr:hypothetical protein OGATHE_000586 [Ogataea polymorpha]